jgi:hypothetical protein
MTRAEASPPRRLSDFGGMAEPDCSELGEALGLPDVPWAGVLIPPTPNHYSEYVDRAEGRAPTLVGDPHWR